MTGKLLPQCAARVWHGFHDASCTRRGRYQRFSRPVCGQHAKQVDQWDTEGRALLMVNHWWKWAA